MRSVVSDASVLSFVNDATVPQLTLASTADSFNQVEECDSDDRDNDADIESEELVVGNPTMKKVWKTSQGLDKVSCLEVHKMVSQTIQTC